MATERIDPNSTKTVFMSTSINASPSTVFKLLSDIPNYNTWLRRSTTGLVSDTPITTAAGTTSYVEVAAPSAGPGGFLHSRSTSNLSNSSCSSSGSRNSTVSTSTSASTSGVAAGEVLEIDERQRRIVFHQLVALKPAILGLVIDVTVEMQVKHTTRRSDFSGFTSFDSYSPTASLISSRSDDDDETSLVTNNCCTVEREVRLQVPRSLRPLKSWLAGFFDKDSRRTMQELKTYSETVRA